MLSTGAFNALLKIMEEPPAHVMFILATTEVHKIPATILSRCQRFDFYRIPRDAIASRLEYIAGKEGFTVTREAAATYRRPVGRSSAGCHFAAGSLFLLQPGDHPGYSAGGLRYRGDRPSIRPGRCRGGRGYRPGAGDCRRAEPPVHG